SYLVLEDDADLVLYGPDKKRVWHSDSGGYTWTPRVLPRLRSGERLNVNDRLVNANQDMHVIMQADGNLVLYRNEGHEALWHTATWGKPVVYALMEPDGNFVCRDVRHALYWSTGTNGNPGAYVLLDNGGDLIVFNAANRPIWDSNTNLRRWEEIPA